MARSLQDDILNILAGGVSYWGHSRFQEDGGAPFEAVTETDLYATLRELGWSFSGNILSEVRAAGFQVRQAYQFQGRVRRVYKNGQAGRTLAKYQTIIFI